MDRREGQELPSYPAAESARLGWGVIGAGDIVRRRVAPAFRDSPSCDLVAISRARADRVKLGIAYYGRFYPAVMRVNDLIASQDIGQPVFAQLNALEWFDPDREPAVDGAVGRAVTQIEDAIYAVSPTGR